MLADNFFASTGYPRSGWSLLTFSSRIFMLVFLFDMFLHKKSMIFHYLPFITLKGYNHMIPYGSTRSDLDVWIGLGHLRFGMQNIKSKTKTIKRSRIFHIFHIFQIRIYRHKVPHEAVVSHSVQVFFPSKKVFPCMLTSLFAGWCSSNGDLLMIFCCYVRFCLHKMENYTKHYQKIQKNIKHSRIFHIFQMYTGYSSIKLKMM